VGDRLFGHSLASEPTLIALCRTEPW
jgi:hypothetical protein